MDTSPERRREPRVPSEGPVSLTVLTPIMRTIEAELVDVSVSGLRIRHRDRLVETGTEVEFNAAGRRGRARIMWSRHGEGDYEAGLYILREG